MGTKTIKEGLRSKIYVCGHKSAVTNMFAFGSCNEHKKVAHNNGVFVGCGYLMYFIIKYDIKLFQK